MTSPPDRTNGGAELMLPRGITGFNVPDGHPRADPKDFRADCLRVVAPLSGRVEDRPQVLAPHLVNFLTQVLVLPGAEVTALLNRHYSWLGFCRPLEPGDCRLAFVDPRPRRVADSFAALGRYRVLSSEELDQPVTEAMCMGLGRAEMDQLRYWSKLSEPDPIRVGTVVFNFWD
jgi:hypothetical protein